MGAHLYWLQSGSGGWWQFDNREQDGTQDLYDGGYFWCDAYDDCDGGEDPLYNELYFNGAGTVSFTVTECSYGMVATGVEEPKPAAGWSTTGIVSGAALSAAIILGVRHMANREDGEQASYKTALF